MEVILQSHLSILECELRKRERYFAETFDGSEQLRAMPVYQRYKTGSIMEESRQHTRTVFSSSCLWRLARQNVPCILVDPRTEVSSETKGGGTGWVEGGGGLGGTLHTTHTHEKREISRSRLSLYAEMCDDSLASRSRAAPRARALGRRK